MAEHEKKLHVSVILEGDNVDQIDVYKIFSEIEGTKLCGGNFNCYITEKQKKVDKPEKK